MGAAPSTSVVRSAPVFVLVVGTVGGIPAGGRNLVRIPARRGYLVGRYFPVDRAATASARSPGGPHKQPQHHAQGANDHQDVTDSVNTEAVRGYGRDAEPEDGSHRDQENACPDRHGLPPL